MSSVSQVNPHEICLGILFLKTASVCEVPACHQTLLLHTRKENDAEGFEDNIFF